MLEAVGWLAIHYLYDGFGQAVIFQAGTEAGPPMIAICRNVQFVRCRAIHDVASVNLEVLAGVDTTGFIEQIIVAIDRHIACS
ncbi:hypothetical protein D3C80_1793310 [compost metagenome]